MIFISLSAMTYNRLFERLTKLRKSSAAMVCGFPEGFHNDDVQNVYHNWEQE